MARPIKKGLDYFSVDVNFFSDIRVRRLIRNCGGGAVGVLFGLLCTIYRNGYFATWDNDLAFVTAEATGATEQQVIDVVQNALRADYFDQAMFDQHRILTSRETQEQYLFVSHSSRSKRAGILCQHNLLESEQEEEAQ